MELEFYFENTVSPSTIRPLILRDLFTRIEKLLSSFSITLRLETCI